MVTTDWYYFQKGDRLRESAFTRTDKPRSAAKQKKRLYQSRKRLVHKADGLVLRWASGTVGHRQATGAQRSEGQTECWSASGKASGGSGMWPPGQSQRDRSEAQHGMGHPGSAAFAESPGLDLERVARG